jgi:hypothetical protein
MNRFAGKQRSVERLLLCFALALFLFPLASRAELSATVDRREIAMGETLRLTLMGDAGEQPAEIDLTPLNNDWEILSRSSATNARFINGQNQITRTLEMELGPLREGALSVPSLTAGGRRTTPLAIRVNPEPIVAAGDALVLFEASVDRPAVYVQAELMVTVTLQQAINLDGGEISAFDVPDAVVEQLERRSFQRRLGNRTWLVTELRYAIYPQKSGILTIPAVGFTAREVQTGRSLLGARLGRRIRMASTPIEIQVRGVPSSFPGEVWLPARSLRLEEDWSLDPKTLTVGDSTTRTMTLIANGLQGNQLPPLNSVQGSFNVPELKFYPDQESIDQTEVVTGLQGGRVQSEALVARASGEWDLPEIRVPWWNTETDSLSYAVLPRRTVVVAPGTSIEATLGPTTFDSDTLGATPTPLWMWAIAGSGWLATLCLLGLLLMTRRIRSAPKTNPSSGEVNRAGKRQLLVTIRRALEAQDAGQLRHAILQWGASHHGTPFASLEALAAVSTPELAALLHSVDKLMYGKHDEETDLHALTGVLREEPSPSQAGAQQEGSLSLYPSS